MELGVGLARKTTTLLPKIPVWFGTHQSSIYCKISWIQINGDAFIIRKRGKLI